MSERQHHWLSYLYSGIFLGTLVSNPAMEILGLASEALTLQNLRSSSYLTVYLLWSNSRTPRPIVRVLGMSPRRFLSLLFLVRPSGAVVAPDTLQCLQYLTAIFARKLFCLVDEPVHVN